MEDLLRKSVGSETIDWRRAKVGCGVGGVERERGLKDGWKSDWKREGGMRGVWLAGCITVAAKPAA